MLHFFLYKVVDMSSCCHVCIDIVAAVPDDDDGNDLNINHGDLLTVPNLFSDYWLLLLLLLLLLILLPLRGRGGAAVGGNDDDNGWN